MKSVVKKTGVVVLALLSILVLLGVVVTLVIDPNDYKDDIQKMARDQANLELTLAGDIRWSLWPLGLSLGQATAASTATPDKPFAQLDQLGLSVRFWPLLSRQVQLDTIRIDGLALTLERDARGRANWDGVGAPTPPAAVAGSAPSSAPPAPLVAPPQDEAPLTVAIDSLVVDRSRLDYRDARSGLRVAVDNLHLESQIQGASSGSIQNLNLALQARVDRVTVDSVPLDQVQIQARAAGGVITLQDLRAVLYGGSIQASGDLDLRQAQAALAVRAKASDVPIERLLALSGGKSPVRGGLHLQADVQTRGNDQNAWIAGLNGKGDFAIKGGVLQDSNLDQQLCRGIALLNRKTPGNTPAARDIPFEELGGSMTVTQGVVNNPDLRVRIPQLSLAGNGLVDLARLTMDYRLQVKIQGNSVSAGDPACAINPLYVGLEVPLRCNGTLAAGAKACGLDRAGMVQIAARLLGNTLNEQVGKSLDTFINKDLGADKVVPQLQDTLRGLFK